MMTALARAMNASMTRVCRSVQMASFLNPRLCQEGWVGRAARCLLGRPFSARPPAEPDVTVSQSSGSPVTTA